MPSTRSSFLRSTLAFLIASGFALLVIVAASLWLVDGARRQADEVTEAQQMRLHALHVLLLLQDAETGQRGYLLTGEGRYLAPYERAKAEVPPELDALLKALGNDGRETQTLRPLVAAKMQELQQTVGLARAGRAPEALAIVRTDRGKDLMDAIRQEMGGVIDRSDAEVHGRMAAFQSSAAVLRYVTVAGGAFIVLFVCGAAWSVLRYTRELIAARAEVEALNQDLERRVQSRTAELTRANEEIQRFAYIVSHDLRSPLVNVMGFTSELEEGLATVGRYFATPRDRRDEADAQAAERAANDEMPEAIGFVRAATTKMDGLINAILKLSREGGRVLMPETVDLGALVERQAASLRHQLGEHCAEVVAAGRLPTLVSDRLALEQVFGNVIDNAVKYLRADRPGRVVVRADEERSRVTIAIEDNGRGIAPEDFERIFELFRRSGAQDQPGEGIGLAHVRALVRRLGGEINVRSTLGEGSVFRITLPKVLRLGPEGESQ